MDSLLRGNDVASGFGLTCHGSNISQTNLAQNQRTDETSGMAGFTCDSYLEPDDFLL